eukprot:CAMPEP_0119378884 /NCGR_PEP_ID=MMETSP1334-20130426/50402_1 /TAXON_ID=127549 /ORGANISM="Calcidiscus leptoporus, Strain RCC1130" /LENGTH=547 /DNA_ID=CAMNT_0007398247 /DNA_START=17 /DNA_END=1660 /DNA_ORIENTATION=-
MSFEVDTTPDAGVQQLVHDGPDKRKRKKTMLLARERALASLVFEDASQDITADEDDGVEMDGSEEGEEGEEGVLGVERSAQHGQGEEQGEGEGEEAGDAEGPSRARSKSSLAMFTPAWVDDDDATVSVDVMAGSSRLRKLRRTEKERKLQGADYGARLRQQFESTQPKLAWASLPARKKTHAHDGVAAEGGSGDDGRDDDEQADASLLRSTMHVLGRAVSLPSGELSMKRMADVNVEEPSKAVVQALSWHPNGQLALTAGYDKTLRLFRVGGSSNVKVQSVHMPKIVVNSAAFTADGAQVIACGKGRDWAVFDLHAGKVELVPGVMGRSENGFEQVLPSADGKHLALVTSSGALLLVSAKTKQLVGTLQSAGSKWGCQSAAFSPDGSILYASGQGGQVQVWDVARRCCVHTWRDQGGLRVAALATSNDGNLLATGADSGAVNLYEVASLFRSASPKPLKEFLNVRTAITELAFNPASEVLCFASKYTKASLRMAHIASRRVFANWPTAKTPLNYVQCCAFSPNSGFVSLGNDKGKALLYRINHYERA